jgi:hypothetical protein
MILRRLSGTALVVACAFALGCGGSDRHDVSGTVSFNGQPVPAGRIFFTPDASQGNKGNQGYADIKDGRYDTSQGGRGAPGGPVIVRIVGADGQASENAPLGKPLFNEYQTKAELPEESAEQNFNVPAEAAQGVNKNAPLP